VQRSAWLLVGFQRVKKPYGKSVELINPGLTILGCTTPKEVQDSRFSQTGGLGLTSRFLIMCVPHFVPGTDTRPPVNRNKELTLLGEMNRISQMRGMFEWTPEALEADRTLKHEVDAFMLDNPGTTLRSNYMSRKQIQVQKLAICFSAMRDSRRIILREDIVEAKKLVELTEPTLMEAFGMQIEYRDRSLMSKILDKLPEVGVVSEEKLLGQFRDDGQAIPDGTEFREAIQGLERMGILTTKSDKHMTYFGRKAQ